MTLTTRALAQSLTLAAGSPASLLLPRWRIGKARVRSGRGNAKIAYVGDSTTAGLGAISAASGSFAGARPYSPPVMLAGILSGHGLPARCEGIYGDNNTGSNLAAYDARITLGSGWGTYLDTSALGGNPIYNSTTTSTLAIAVAAFDTLGIRYRKFGGAGQFTVNVDGAAALTPNGGSNAYVDCNGADGMGLATFSVARAAHTVNIARNGTGADVRLLSIEPDDSTTSKVIVAGLGISGAKIADWTSSSITPTHIASLFTDVNAFKPDLTIINLTINDWNAGTALASYSSGLAALVAAAQAAGSDVILMIGNASDTALTSASVQNQYAQAVYAIAGTTIPVFDLTARLGTYAQANALGIRYDGTHLNYLGYGDVAQAVGEVLLAA